MYNWQKFSSILWLPLSPIIISVAVLNFFSGANQVLFTMSFPTPISYAPPPVFPLSVLGFRFLPLRSMVGLCYFSYTVIDPDVISVFCKWKSIFSGTLVVEDAFFSPVDVVGIFVTFKRLKLSMLMFNNSVLFCLSGLHICFLWWFHFSLLLLWLCTVS